MSKMLNTWWKLAISKGATGFFIVAGSALCATDPDWLPKAAVQLILAFVAGARFLEGFLDRTIANLEKFRNPLGIKYDDTQVLVKKDSTTDSSTVIG